jgi:hypothetical protein
MKQKQKQKKDTVRYCHCHLYARHRTCVKAFAVRASNDVEKELRRALQSVGLKVYYFCNLPCGFNK